MTFLTKTIACIPARMGSQRLSQKPLRLIHNIPLIVHTWRAACAALHPIPVVVVCDCADIACEIEKHGGRALIVQDALTGTDRVYAGICTIDPEKKYEIVINIQGDQPFFHPHLLQTFLEPFSDPRVHMTTGLKLWPWMDRHCVGVDIQTVVGRSWFRCLDFFREKQAMVRHLGIYAFRRNILEKFVSYPQTIHEKERSLEQMRALDHDFFIAGVLLGKKYSITVDTVEDLKKAEQWFNKHVKDLRNLRKFEEDDAINSAQ